MQTGAKRSDSRPFWSRATIDRDCEAASPRLGINVPARYETQLRRIF